MNIKGRLPIIGKLLYNIPVTVLDHSTDRWRNDRARVIKKKGVHCYEFARQANRLPLFDRTKGKMFVYTKDGKQFQPMTVNVLKDNIYLPNYALDQWREMEMRAVEERYKPKENSQKELIKFIGIGIMSFLIIIALANFITSVPMIAPSCNCAINGMDLARCQQLLLNASQSNTGGVI